MDEVIKQFYSNLVTTLPMDDACFRSALYTADLLPHNLKPEIQSKPTRADKAEHFLDHGIKNDVANFMKLLEVMEKSDDKPTKNLSKQIRNKIDMSTCCTTTGCFLNKN